MRAREPVRAVRRLPSAACLGGAVDAVDARWSSIKGSGTGPASAFDSDVNRFSARSSRWSSIDEGCGERLAIISNELGLPFFELPISSFPFLIKTKEHSFINSNKTMLERGLGRSPRITLFFKISSNDYKSHHRVKKQDLNRNSKYYVD